jgi:hypothetical protein
MNCPCCASTFSIVAQYAHAGVADIQTDRLRFTCQTIHSTLLRCFAPRQGRTRILGGRAPAAHTPRHADVLAAKYDGWRGLSGAHGAPHRWRYYYYCCRLTAYEGISRDGTPPLVATGVRSPCGGNGAAFCAPATQSIDRCLQRNRLIYHDGRN